VGAWGETSPIVTSIYPTALNAGAAYVLFMNSNATVREYTRLSSRSHAGMPPLYYYDRFGMATAVLGDLAQDGTTAVAVGAPGRITSVVFILFLESDGSPRSYMTIRGYYGSNRVPENVTAEEFYNAGNRTYTMNPTDLPMDYRMGFGRSLAAMDIDSDGVMDLAIGTEAQSSGQNAVYIMFLERDGRVKAWTELSSATGGVPSMKAHNQFGSSVVSVGDLDRDNVTDIAVGAMYESDGIDGRPRSGVVYILFMNENGTAREVHKISALSHEGKVSNGAIPLVSNDNCGAALTNVGDMNKDAYASQRPWIKRTGTNGLDVRQSVQDIVMGCPQMDTRKLPGRLFVLFLDELGGHKGYRELPHPKRDLAQPYATFPKLPMESELGCSLATYSDVDDNDLVDLIVGSKGDDDGGTDTGAIYIMFLRRRRWHSFVSDHFMYLFSIFFPISFCCCCCITSCIYFFWYYRRKPDLVELAVKSSNIEIGKKRERKRQKIVIASPEDEYPT